MSIHVRIDLGYDGSRFAGSQRQRDDRTIQGELERALETLTGDPVSIALAGRTDRGVHAVGQVASADVSWRRGAEDLRSGLHALTPDDIAVFRVRPIEPDFHARFSARSREYRYRIWTGEDPPVLLRGIAWHRRRALDLDRMNEAAALFTGERDFRSYAGKGFGTPESPRETARTVTRSEWRTVPADLESASHRVSILEYRIEANSFLPHMVRNIVGSLVQAGSGRQSVRDIAELIEMRDRRRAPAPAPPQGLVLWQVRYDEDEVAASCVPPVSVWKQE